MLRDLLDLDARLAAGGPRPARHLPWRFALEVRMFMGGGLAIVDEAERLGARILGRRPVVSGAHKARIALGALLHT